MRPLRLELENFTVFRGVHHIDFSPLKFFVIRGRTGAGKSSLVDAICYALYGRVPRYARERQQENLISKGQKYMRVAFDFAVRGRQYRIERFYGLKKGSEIRFYEEGRPRPFRSDELLKHLRELLRLDYETFTKVIVLPQNQFDRFLKPDRPAERREVLNQLIGLYELYTSLKELIAEEFSKVDAEAKGIERSLAELSVYTQEYMESLKERLKVLEDRRSELLERKKELEEALRKAVEFKKLLTELEHLEEAIRLLMAREGDVEEKRSRLRTGLELMPYAPKLEEYERLSTEEEKLHKELKTIEYELLKYGEEKKNTQEYISRLEEEKNKLETYMRRLEKIRVLIERVNHLESLLKEEKSLKEEKEKVSEKLTQLEKELDELMSRLEKGKALMEEVNKKLAELEKSSVEKEYQECKLLEDRLKRLLKLKEELKELERRASSKEREWALKRQRREELERRGEELERSILEKEERIKGMRRELEEEVSIRELYSKAKELEALKERLRLMEEEDRSIKLELERVKAQREELELKRQQFYAYELRRSLKEGDECPVCGGVFHKKGHELHEELEAKELLDRLSNLTQELGRLEGRVSALERERREAQLKAEELSGLLRGYSLTDLELKVRRLEELKRTLSMEEEEALKLKEELRRFQEELKRLQEEERKSSEEYRAFKGRVEALEGEIKALSLELGDEESLIRRIEEAERSYEELLNLRDKEKKYRQRLEELQRQIAEKEKEMAKLFGTRSELDKRLEELLERIEGLRGELLKDGVEEEPELARRKLSKEAEDINRKIKQTEEEYKRATDYYQKLLKDESHLTSSYKEKEAFLEKIKNRKAELAGEIYHLLERFGSFEAVKALVIKPEELERLRAEVESYEKELHSLEHARSSLSERLSQMEKPPEEEVLQRELSQVEASLVELEREHGSIEGELQRVKDALVRKRGLEEQLERLKRERSIYEILRSDFRDNEFPEFVSQIMLKRIVDVASRYLFSFTGGAYSFEKEGGDLYIMDHALGDKRIVASLSGGETFLASLSLAFAVADILSEKAPLESLFIDEGFGSLDRESRESLGEFFETIKQNTSRMVGIITHVEDIAEKFEQRIEVEKKGGKASIKVIY